MLNYGPVNSRQISLTAFLFDVSAVLQARWWTDCLSSAKCPKMQNRNLLQNYLRLASTFFVAGSGVSAFLECEA